MLEVVEDLPEVVVEEMGEVLMVEEVVMVEVVVGEVAEMVAVRMEEILKIMTM